MALARATAADPPPDPWEAAAAKVRAELEERGSQRKAVAVGRRSFREWAELLPETRGPLNFRDFAFQVEMYGQEAANDDEQVVMKATQVGVSTQSIRWVLYHADVHQRVCLYTFPTDKELGDFSRQRIKPVIKASEYLMSRLRGDGVDNVSQKQIGTGGWVYFRGLQRPIDSIDADVGVFDEYDTSDPENIEASERRFSGLQSAGLIRRVGVPSIPGYGIGDFYDKSDQRVWTVKCQACSTWNPIDGVQAFERNVDQENIALVCSKCRRPIDVRDGEWVPRFPDRGTRGYHVPKLLVPGRKALARVIANSKKTRPDQKKAFITHDLGEPFATAEGRLSREAVLACTRPELRLHEHGYSTHNPVVMGVDVASMRALNVEIAEMIDIDTDRILWAGEIEDDPARGSAYQQLCELMVRYGVLMAGIDRHPEGRFAQMFAQKFPGRVYTCSFFNPAPGGRTEPEPWIIDHEGAKVSLWRTKVYDALFERYRLQQIVFPPLDQMPPGYADHLGNLYREQTELPNQQTHVIYKRTGPEDYAQTGAYRLAARELYLLRAGLERVAGGGPQPLIDEQNDFVGVDLSIDADPVDYEPGFSMDDEPGAFGAGWLD